MAEPARRTVVIRGQVADRYTPRRSTIRPVETDYRSPRAGTRAHDDVRPGDARRSYERPRPSSRRRRPYDPPRARPDRIAMWAVLLGVVLILAAATSSHAAVMAHIVHLAHLRPR